ncbi:FtsK/SpoIIIE domain-containing protein [Pseudarthrobacter sp. BRE9]|uniref:FtsK/SpoIIIE domain-containing protein n=1 Tax=Pseudarthrobacter sp. BRE9 TaxID=2962582 RepID=UPI0028817383|nr:FtsK/SpoIIIE domain-containing protein [Pseudarthrobacter sp. BRE9]MDT0167636.1 FtsK/SpoIIIE domain-containing protein [Pseudarthrobacter sp. BRE9]
MTLNCTLVGGPGSARPQPPVELSIDAPAGTAGQVLHQQLVHKFGTGAVTVDGKDLCSLVLGVPPLVEAAVLVDGGPAPSARRPRRQPIADAAPPLVLAVDSGAAAGTVVPLRRGSYTIGRSGTRIVIPDPELSREHARLVVTDTKIMLFDLDSANGTYVDGERVRSAVVSTDSTIMCGQSNLLLVFADVPGKILADAGMSVAEPIVVPGRVDTGNRALIVLTAVLPLSLGVLLAVLTGMWMFLAFSAASVFSALVPAASGRRQRRALSAALKLAVEEDRERRRRCAPPLSIVALAAQKAEGTTSASSSGDGVWLRLGQGERPANIRIEPGGAAGRIPSAGTVPIVLDPGRPLTTLGGTRFAVDGAIRSVLMQLAGYPRAGAVRVVVHGRPGALPLAARFLHRVTLTATLDAALNLVAGTNQLGCERAVLLIHGDNSTAAAEHSVREAALQQGWQVLHFLPQDGEWPAPDIFLSERRSTLVQDHRETVFVPDLVPNEVFGRFCRHHAGARRRDMEQVRTVPASCSLDQVLPLTLTATADRWLSSTRNEGLPVPVGLSTSGTKTLDLLADGPHLLVAGTTGSGKSELLRSLTLALALTYPPDRVNFFFIDFKGGSGLGPLSDLVHCVGVQTDLSPAEMERTLTSLRAEVQLRERCLAAAHVPDLSTYRSTTAAEDFVLPHLVIVIDEFRMLVDDAPEVLRELLRIASIGRSLGIHLIMATQRPQGALTADIRANVTTSIALRVQSDMESVDIVNSKDAAAISVDTPGRAFLARGTEAAEEFQAASLSSVSEGKGPSALTVHRTKEYLVRQAAEPGVGRASPLTPAQAVEPLAALVRRLCTAQQKPVPRRPVAPPLPDQLEEPAAGPATRESGSPGPPPLEPGTLAGQVRLGLMDVPEKQKLEPLVWSPASHGHAAFIGSPASGAGSALELAVHKLMAGADEAHLYILDAPGSLWPLAGEGRVGAHAALHDLRRGVRILERLVRELGQRLSQPASKQVPLVLVLVGWGSWVSAFRSGPLAWAEDLVQDLVRDGARAGITLLVHGERELVTARFFGALPNRFFFPAGSSEESRAMWPRMPAIPAVRGRAAAFGPVSGGGPVACQFYRNPATETGEGGSSAGYPPPVSPPFRVEPLPLKIAVGQVAAFLASAGIHQSAGRAHPGQEALGGTRRFEPSEPRRRRDVFLGVTGDEPAPVSLRIPGSGVTAILGNPGSGKSNTLLALAALNPAQQWCTSPVPPDDAGDFWKDVLGQAEGGGLPRETVLLVDDVDLLAPPAVRALEQLNALGYSLVVTSAYSPMLFQRVPLVMNARAAGVGLLLGPRSMADGDLFGVRFEVEANAPPGRGVLISGGRSSPLQVAWAGASG